MIFFKPKQMKELLSIFSPVVRTAVLANPVEMPFVKKWSQNLFDTVSENFEYCLYPDDQENKIVDAGR